MLIGACSGRFYALDRRSGVTRWSHDANQKGMRTQFHGDPLVRGGTVFVGTDRSEVGSMLALHLGTGKPRWQFDVLDDHAQQQGVPTAIVGPPSAVCGITFGDEAFCLDSENGTVRWRFRSGHDWNPGTLRPSPALIGHRFVFPALDGVVYCLNAADGALLWKRKLSAPTTTSVVSDDKSIYVGSEDGRLYRLSVNDGSIKGEIDLRARPYFSPLLHGGVVYLFAGSDEDNRLIAVDRALKKVLWQKAVPGGWSSPRPYMHKGHLVAGTAKGDLVALDATTGASVWSEHVGGVVRAIGGDGDVMYVGSLSGRLTAISRKETHRR